MIFLSLQIYPCELEKAEKYEDFGDFCHTFEFSRGKDEEDEESNIVGELKVIKHTLTYGKIKICE